MLPDDLPQDFLEFNARFGTDEQCREYLFRTRWPDGFRCDGCGHDHAHTLRTRLVYECVACRKQHSLLAGTIFEQTKTALARWFLAIYLVTSSKGGIAAAELQRQLGFGSYQTAGSWLHKLRKAMVRPDREPLAGRVEADETYVGGPRPGKRGRGAAGKTLVAGAVEAGQAGGRRLGRLRLAVVPDASAASLEGFLGAAVAAPAAVATDGWSGYAGLAAEGYWIGSDAWFPSPWLRPAGRGWVPSVRLGPLRPRAGQAQRRGRQGSAPAARHPPRLRPRQALAAGHPSWRGQPEASAGLPRRVRVPVQPPHRQARQPRLRPPRRAGGPHQAGHLPGHRRRD